MIGLDTNLLVRYITQDDPVQSPIASEVFERRLSGANPGFVSVVATAELVWVLGRAYHFSAAEVASAVERLLAVEVLEVQNAPAVFTAMLAIRDGIGSFSDVLIAELGAEVGCEQTLTFDRKALRIAGFLAP
jgi:predicted nucleic-acid-binding protein